MSDFLFTSESVSEGHPDKVADQISDAVLDAILKQDKSSRVAAETLVKDNLVVLAGEITTNARDQLRRGRARHDPAHRLYRPDHRLRRSDVHRARRLRTAVAGHRAGRDEGKGLDLEQGAGDQGLMFGYACDETPSLMPLPIYLSHRLVERQAELPQRPAPLAASRRKVAGDHPLRERQARVDRYRGPLHAARKGRGPREAQGKRDRVIKPVLPKSMVKGKLTYLVNPTGSFEIGGPKGDCGVTGRKSSSIPTAARRRTAAAFSGKDPPRWTAPRPTRHAIRRKTSWRPALPPSAWCRCPTPSA